MINTPSVLLTNPLQEELSNARTQIEELHEENRTVKQTNQDLQSTISQLQIDSRQHADEVATLRSRSNLSQTNWAKERDELISKEAFARDEFESARQAMQDWEVLAMEERSLRENLGDRVAELEDQLNSQREMYERVARERDDQNSTVDGLQRALQDIQDGKPARRYYRHVVLSRLTRKQHENESCVSWSRTRNPNSRRCDPRPKLRDQLLRPALPISKPHARS